MKVYIPTNKILVCLGDNNFLSEFIMDMGLINDFSIDLNSMGKYSDTRYYIPLLYPDPGWQHQCHILVHFGYIFIPVTYRKPFISRINDVILVHVFPGENINRN